MSNKIIMHVRPAKIIHDGSGEPYQGDYNITPSLSSDIELETAGKTLAENITVFKIPQTRPDNEAGGQTLIIGKENA